MKFYCELNKTFYDTEEACAAAEQELLEAQCAKEREKDTDYQELCQCRQEMMEAQARHCEASRAFSEARKIYDRKAASYINKYSELPEGFISPDAIWKFIFN